MAAGLLDVGQILWGRLSKSVAGSSNVTLTQAEYENGTLEFTGVLTGSIQVIVPLASSGYAYRWLCFNNTSGAFTVTVIGASGTGVLVRQGCYAVVESNGTNIVRVTPDLTAAEVLYVTSILGLTGALQAPTQVNDANGNEVVKFGSVASAVNELTVTNAATGNPPLLAPTGGDTNISLAVRGKGSGGGKLQDGAGSDKVAVDTTGIGFFGVTPAARPSAYTQTYATATGTHSNLTSATLTDSTGGSADTTVADVGAAFSQATLNNNFADVVAQINALRVDLVNAKGVLNQVIDNLQTLGLLQ